MSTPEYHNKQISIHNEKMKFLSGELAKQIKLGNHTAAKLIGGKMSDTKNQILKHAAEFKRLSEEAPTNIAGDGSAHAGLDNNPPGVIAADKKKRKLKSFKLFARGGEK